MELKLIIALLLIIIESACAKTKVPKTKAPQTTAPETPETKVPETPETKIPETPETKVPETPETKVPETPETKVPETKVPETPETKVPETKTPETKTPETKVPETPETKTPETKTPETKTPETKVPETPGATVPAGSNSGTVDPNAPPTLTEEEIESRWSLPNDAKIPPGGDIPTLQIPNTPYTIFRKRANWFRAHEYCRLHKKNLASFPTAEIYDAVVGYIFSISVYDPFDQHEWLGARRYWIGMNDLAGEGEWRWIDTGELVGFDRFTINQPDHITKPKDLTHHVRKDNEPGAHCVVMWNPKFENGTKHTWDDHICIGDHTAYYFICEDFVEKVKKY